MGINQNAEKQARHRKKELLKRRADQLLHKWQLEPWKHHRLGLDELQALLEAAIKLPSGWTSEDYINAENKLYTVFKEVVSPENQLSNDVRDSRNIKFDESNIMDLPKVNEEIMRAEKNTSALAAHFISAIKLSTCDEADLAAALMEALRFVGRNLTSSNIVPCSQATAMCLASINAIYSRPDWFAEKLAETLSKKMHPELAREVGKFLIEL